MVLETTYRGVFIDIEKSNICSLKNGMYFYFCSKAMKEKFDKNIDEYIKDNKEKLNKLYPNTLFINYEWALTIEFYCKIEKRGYRIETQNGSKIKRGVFVGDVEFREELKQEE